MNIHFQQIMTSTKDVTTRECSDITHVEPVSVTEYLDTVQMDYKGKCAQIALEQQQQVTLRNLFI